MSDRSLSLENPLAMLRLLRAGCAADRPLHPALAGWLATSIDRYLTRKSDSLEAALGIVSTHGGLAWWRKEAILERNEALRALASAHFARHSPTLRARAMAVAAARYGAGSWRFDRSLEALPVSESQTIRGYLFRAFRSGATMPLCERQIRNILREGRQGGPSTSP